MTSPPLHEALATLQKEFVGRKVAVSDAATGIDEHDPTMAELRKATEAAGFGRVRVWLPKTIGTMEFRSGRLNVHVDVGAHTGVWRIIRLSIG